MWELEATFRLIRRLLTVRIIGVFPVNHRSNSWAASGLIDIGDEPFAECDLTRNHGDWSSHGGQMRILHIIYMYIYICVYIYLFIYGIYSYDNVVAGCRCHVLGWSWMDWYFSVVCSVAISLTNLFCSNTLYPIFGYTYGKHLDIWIYHQSSI